MLTVNNDSSKSSRASELPKPEEMKGRLNNTDAPLEKQPAPRKTESGNAQVLAIPQTEKKKTLEPKGTSDEGGRSGKPSVLGEKAPSSEAKRSSKENPPAFLRMVSESQKTQPQRVGSQEVSKAQKSDKTDRSYKTEKTDKKDQEKSTVLSDNDRVDALPEFLWERKSSEAESSFEANLPSFFKSGAKASANSAHLPSTGKSSQKKAAGSTDPNGLKKEKTTASKKPNNAQTVFIVSMCLLTPIAVLAAVALAVVFAALFIACFLLAGIMSILLILSVIAGVVLALVGVTYGVISMMTGTDFTVITGQYELGLGLAITGITIIGSALLYSGITGLIPFVCRKLWKFAVFVFKKCKQLVHFVYRRSTQL